MAHNICKIGKFSDGNQRIRVVASGYDADPAPTDPTKIIFDSDWPEVFISFPAYYGSMSVSYVTNSGGARTSGNYNITWPTLSYSPIAVLADPPRFHSPPAYAVHAGTLWISTIANAYQIRLLLPSLGTLSNPGPSGMTYSPFGADGQPTPDSETYTIAWWAMLIDTTVLGNTTPPSRSGTNPIMMTSQGPVVAKPGKSVSSTNIADFLIPPLSMGAVLGQPYMVGTLTAISLQSGFTIGATTYYEYWEVIPHSLGYIPICLVSDASLGLVPGTAGGVFVDATNIYVYQYSSAAPTSSLAISATTYYVFRTQWF